MLSQVSLALGLLLGAAAVTASPVDSRASSSCRLMGDSPLGFNVTGIPIYASTDPKTFAIRPGQENSRGHFPLLPSLEPPSNMAFYSCDDAISGGFFKGSTAVSLGYIVDLSFPGNCIGVSSVETTGAKLASEKCDIGSPRQNWQFSQNTFYNYWRVDFLGNTKGPYPSGKTYETFPFQQSSPGYSFSIDGDSFKVTYNPKFHGNASNTLAFNSRNWAVKN